MKSNKTIILASASARRRKILTEIGISFEVIVSDVEEVLYINHPRNTAIENARKKAIWCMKQRPGRYIIAADTVVDFEGQCITKPSTMLEAREFMKMFSGKKQIIYTAVAFVKPAVPRKAHEPEIHVGVSSVRFRTLNSRIISDYFSKVDPMDKAGAYDIDQHGDMIIESHTGSLSNISGLPAKIVADWLAKEGLSGPAPNGLRTNKPCARRGI